MWGDTSLEWAQWASFEGVEAMVADTLHAIEKPTFMQRIRLLESCKLAGSIDDRDLNVDHPLLVMDVERAALAGRFALRLAFAHARRFLGWLHGYPVRLCLLAHDRAEVRCAVLEEFRKDYENCSQQGTVRAWVLAGLGAFVLQLGRCGANRREVEAREVGAP